MNKRYRYINAIDFGDERSSMCVIEGNKDIPFQIKRIFYDYNSKDCSIRGNHANLYSKFAFICMAGSCVIEVDDGYNQDVFFLNTPQRVLIVDNLVWKKMKNFSSDSVLLVLSDQYYNKNEYIHDYEKFVEVVKHQGAILSTCELNNICNMEKFVNNE